MRGRNHVTIVTIAAGAVAKDVSCLMRAEVLDRDNSATAKTAARKKGE